MTMAFSGMDKDEAAPSSGTDFWEGVQTKKSCAKVTLSRTHMLENVSVGVVDCARVEDVLGVSVRPRSHGRG